MMDQILDTAAHWEDGGGKEDTWDYGVEGHGGTCATNNIEINEEEKDNHQKLAEKLESIMSFVQNVKGSKGGKAKGGKGSGKKDLECWHCFKRGHVASGC